MSVKQKKRDRECSAEPMQAPTKHKKAERTSVAKTLEEAQKLFIAAKWFNKHMPFARRPIANNVWEMIFNTDKDMDLPDFFEFGEAAPKFYDIMIHIAPLFAEDGYGVSSGREAAGFELLKFVPTTPGITGIFNEMYWHWRNGNQDNCHCKRHFEKMERLMPVFWKLIDKDATIVKLESLIKENK